MPITYGNANYRKKFDAFRIVDQSGIEPLAEAINVAKELRATRKILESAYEGASPEKRAQIALAMAKCGPDEFNAWIKVSEFLYAKPRHVEVNINKTLEQLLGESWQTSGTEQTRLQAGDEEDKLH